MAKVNKINLSYKRTLQMRQFEPAELYGSIEVQVDPGDKLVDVIRTNKKILRDEIDNEIEKLKVSRKNSYDDEMEKTT